MRECMNRTRLIRRCLMLRSGIPFAFHRDSVDRWIRLESPRFQAIHPRNGWLACQMRQVDSHRCDSPALVHR